MKKIVALLGATVGGMVGWWLGALVGPMTGFMLSIVGTGAGIYVGHRLSQLYLP
jgi:membrane protein YqaA with SNARE-associated domain